MKILVGVIPHDDHESLLVLDKGKPTMTTCLPGDAEKEFPNYGLLKHRKLKIENGPVSGPGVFRFRYGPVTSGIREAGSFDLFTYGEKIIRVNIDIGWKHRKIEETMQDLSPNRACTLAEHVCNNFAFSHSVAFSRAVEQAMDIEPDLRTRIWRQLLLEAERIYNHLYVVYRLMSAASQKIPAAHVHALFEQALRLNSVLSGSRFLLGFNRVGSVDHQLDVPTMEIAIKGYQSLRERYEEIYQHSLDNANYLDRLHDSGTFSVQQATEFGLTGPTLRACGLNDDLNGMGEHLVGLPVVTQKEGDALARMETRSEELVNSCQYLVDHLKVSDTWRDEENNGHPSPQKDGEGVGITHAPSGALGYYVRVEDKVIRKAHIFTPSYVGLHAIAATLPEHIFTDFPFVVDSFGVHFADAAC